MQNFLYYFLLQPFVYLLAILPFPVLRGISSGMCFLLYRVVGYRKKVVRNNLRNAFPEKSADELYNIERKFYLHLTDVMLENIKMLAMNRREIRNHIKIPPESLEVIRKYERKNQSFIIVMGHQGNWEWGNFGFVTHFRHELRGIYHELSDPVFEKLFKKMRKRFGTVPVKMNETLRYMLAHKDMLSATAFVTDQAPFSQGAHWTIFLNQETPVYYGTEKIARKMKYPVVFLFIKETKRNHYEMNFETLFEEPEKTRFGEITESHTQKLEQRIKEQPVYWLWSHRRWKRQRPENVPLYREKRPQNPDINN